jgi:hypothetical protein
MEAPRSDFRFIDCPPSGTRFDNLLLLKARSFGLPRRDPLLNFFGVDASQPRSVWRKKGWLHPDDPRGWFQWYCHYYMGRRIPEEDVRQIRRWKQIKRHVAQVRLHCEKGDLTCRKRQRQALLHWAYDSRKIEAADASVRPCRMLEHV